MKNKKIPFYSFLLGLAMFCVLTVNVANANTYNVTKTDDTNDGVCDADCSFREAIEEANNDTTSDHEIMVPSGTYTISLLGTEADDISDEDDNNLFGDFDINNTTSQITITGATKTSVILDGNSISRVLDIHTDNDVILENINIENGHAYNGGGVYAYRSTLEINSCTINLNTSIYDGGGISSRESKTTINYSVIANNTSLDSQDECDIECNGGGGIKSRESDGDLIIEGNLTINDSLIINNYSEEYGGGLCSMTETNIKNSIFSNNTSHKGGGALLYGYFDYYGANDSEITNSTFSDNDSNCKGGGLYFTDTEINLRNLNIKNNIASYGGGIYSGDDATVNLNNSLLKKNSATYGGGIEAEFDSIVNSINNSFYNNIASYGAGIYNSEDAITNISFSTFSNNTAFVDGGAIYAEPLSLETNLKSSILAYNYSGATINNCNTSIDSDGNNIEDIDSCGLNLIKKDLYNNDPLFLNSGIPYDLGGPTNVIGISSASPAIDHSNCRDIDNNIVLIDQRYQTRPNKFGYLKCDSGAYEVQLSLINPNL